MAVYPNSWQLKPDSWHSAILAGVATAMLALLPLSFNLISFFLNYFAALPLYLIGLSCGMHRLIPAALVALALYVATAGIQPGFIFTITTLAPAFLIAYRIHKGDPGGYIVSWITSLAIMIFMAVVMVLAFQSTNILDALKSWFTPFTEQTPFKSMNTRLISLLPGISGLSWIIMCLVNAFLARHLIALIRGRPYATLLDSQLHNNWDIIFGLGLLLALTKVPLFAFIGENVALISCAPIFLVGLGVVYAWLKQYKNPRIWLVGIVFLSFLLVWPGVIVVLLGVLESMLHLRQRWMH